MYVYTVFDALIYSHLNILKCIFLHTKSTVSTNCHPCSLCSVLRVINKKFTNTISSIDGQTDPQMDGRTEKCGQSLSYSLYRYHHGWQVCRILQHLQTHHQQPPPLHYYLIIGDHHIISQDRWNCVLIAKMPEDGYKYISEKKCWLHLHVDRNFPQSWKNMYRVRERKMCVCGRHRKFSWIWK